MKSTWLVPFVLVAGSAHAETFAPPCENNGWVSDGSLPTTLNDLPATPTILLPLGYAYHYQPLEPLLSAIVVEVRDAADAVIEGTLLGKSELSAVGFPLPVAAWRPLRALPPGGSFTLRYAVAQSGSGYCAFSSFEGAMTFATAVAESPAPPTLTLDVSFWDLSSNTSGSSGPVCDLPNARPCPEQPGVCCAPDDPTYYERILDAYTHVAGNDWPHPRYLYLELERSEPGDPAAPDFGLDSAYPAEAGTYEHLIQSPIPPDAPPPAAGTGCVTARLTNIALGGVVATATACADPAAYHVVADSFCTSVCSKPWEPVSEPDAVEDIADPDPFDASAEGNADPSSNSGCAGHPAASLAALLCTGLMALVRRR